MNRNIDLDIPIIDDFNIDMHPFTPNKINGTYAQQIASTSPLSVKDYAKDLISKGWRIYAVDQRRGTCYLHRKVITIPVWVIKNNHGNGKELCWYLSHELAHAYAWIHDRCGDHGPKFMRWLKQICPPDCIHYELGYKPRNAKAAGIRAPADTGDISFLEL